LIFHIVNLFGEEEVPGNPMLRPELQNKLMVKSSCFIQETLKTCQNLLNGLTSCDILAPGMEIVASEEVVVVVAILL